MSEAHALEYLTEEEYRIFELASEERHEYVDGIVRAMTGAALRHNFVAGNLFAALNLATKGTNCRATIEGARLRINDKRHYYPDVMGTCETLTHTHEISEPCLIAEILSPSTTHIDRGEKRFAYLSMPSLRHHLIIDLEANIIEHTSRPDSQSPWTLQICESGDSIDLHCPAVLSITVDALLE
jgi:Uma2 family endonuclease